jgi:predicted GNAT superfamily acetyltransferase
MVLEHEGHPVVAREPQLGREEFLSIGVPADYHGIRERDPKTARDWRETVGNALEQAFDMGYRAVGFSRGAVHRYLLRRP